MIKTPIEIDQEGLEVAAEVLGTKTAKDTVNAALREVGLRPVRLRALARLGEMADQGDFDELLAGQVRLSQVDRHSCTLIDISACSGSFSRSCGSPGPTNSLLASSLYAPNRRVEFLYLARVAG